RNVTVVQTCALPIYLLVQIVDLLVTGDDFLGGVEVTVEQSRRRPCDGMPGEPCHFDKTFAEAVEPLVVGISHEVNAPSASLKNRPRFDEMWKNLGCTARPPG